MSDEVESAAETLYGAALSAFTAERKRLAEEIQRNILENYYFVPVFRHAAVAAIGPRIKAAKWQDVFPTITTAYAYPWEDIELKA